MGEDVFSKLAALVPMPRVNLTRFYGIFASNSKYRDQVIKRKNENKPSEVDMGAEVEKRAAMNWARRLKRAFQIDIDICERCGGYVKMIASIEEPSVIKKILDHLKTQNPANNQLMLPINRAPPVSKLMK